jgi:hypothetical protein
MNNSAAHVILVPRAEPGPLNFNGKGDHKNGGVKKKIHACYVSGFVG